MTYKRENQNGQQMQQSQETLLALNYYILIRNMVNGNIINMVTAT